jgi:hypothetical protein
VTTHPARSSRPSGQARSGQVGVVPAQYGAVRLGGSLRVVSLAGVEERMIGTGEDANLVMPIDVPRCDTSRWSRWLACQRVTCKIALVLGDGAANSSIACVVGSTSISMLR